MINTERRDLLGFEIILPFSTIYSIQRSFFMFCNYALISLIIDRIRVSEVKEGLKMSIDKQLSLSLMASILTVMNNRFIDDKQDKDVIRDFQHTINHGTKYARIQTTIKTTALKFVFNLWLLYTLDLMNEIPEGLEYWVSSLMIIHLLQIIWTFKMEQEDLNCRRVMCLIHISKFSIQGYIHYIFYKYMVASKFIGSLCSGIILANTIISCYYSYRLGDRTEVIRPP